MSKKIRPSLSDATLTPELLLQAIKEAGRPLGIDELLKITRLARKSKKKVEFLLQSLEASGELLRTHGKWFFPKTRKTVTGIFSLQRSGAGFVLQNTGNDIFIPAAHMNDAWDGDTVEALLLPGRHGPRREGRIVNIINAARRQLSVHAIKRQRDGTWLCTPLHQGIQSLFVVDPGDQPITAHDLLLVTPRKKNGERMWEAELYCNLHNENRPQAQEMLAKANNAIPTAFPSQALAETGSLPADPEEKDFSGRRDLRHMPFVTIDGADAKDFDDAVLVEKAKNGFRLFVAIADVAHYVRPGSAIDREAFLRGNSYYFPLSVEPMLPEALSNSLCSLKPGVPRLAMVAEMTFDEKGKEVGASFYAAVIQSKARLTYDQVLAGAVNGEADARESLLPVLPMLEDAIALAKILGKVRSARGSLDFDLPEASFRFDAQGDVSAVVPRESHFAHKLIEEFMVAANESVARHLTAKGKPLLYRVHPAPDQEKLSTLIKYLEQAGLAVFPGRPSKGKKDVLSPGDLNAILQAAKNTPQDYVISRLVLRSMMQAKYGPDNEGHYGLASECYCHFTSPIRRYADLVVHRALKAALGIDKVQDNRGPGLQKIADHINQTERAAMEAEREVHKRLAILYLQDRVGEEFDGIISGVTDFGIFVEIPSHLAEGMVRLNSLADDYYEYIPERQMLRGRAHGKSFSLGRRVRVTLTDVNLGRLEVNFAFSDPDAAAAAPVRVAKPGRGTSGNRRGKKTSGKKTGWAPSGKKQRATPRNHKK